MNLYITSWTKNKKVFPKVYFPKTIFSLKKIILSEKSVLPFGNLRSYGDVCLNNDVMVSMSKFKKIIYFDKKKGIINAESGLLLKNLIPIIVKHKWFLPISPGTKYVSIGGMISNNIHGKNINNNFFYHYIISIKVMLTNGQIITCSKEKNSDLFSSTVGGLGLTGVIISVKFKLKKIQTLTLERKNIFFNKSEEVTKIDNYSKNYEYSVTWIDSFSTENKISGIHFLSKHKTTNVKLKLNYTFKEKKISFYNKFFFYLINNFYLYRVFGIVFKIYHKYILSDHVHFEDFFYPQDKYLNWNEILPKKKEFAEFHLFLEEKKTLKFLKHYFIFCKINKVFSNLIVIKKFKSFKNFSTLINKNVVYGMSFDFSQNQKKMKLIKEFFLNNSKKYNYDFYLAKDLFGNKKNISSNLNYKTFKKKIRKFNDKNKFNSLLSNRYKFT